MWSRTWDFFVANLLYLLDSVSHCFSFHFSHEVVYFTGFFFLTLVLLLSVFFLFFCEGWIGIIHMHFSSCTFFLSPLMCNMGKYSYVWFLKPVKPLKFSILLCAVRFPFKKELDFNFHVIEVHLAICLFWSYWSWWSCKSSFLWEIEMTSFNLDSFLC